MKWLYKTTLIILSIIFIASALATVYFYNRITSSYDKNQNYNLNNNPQYHFSLILNNEEGVYWQKFKEGVFDAAHVNNVVVEYNPVAYTSSSDLMVEYINIANKSMLDGIIVNGYSTQEYIDALDNAIADGTPVVLVGFEPIESNYVGTNYYEYGKQAAQLIIQTYDDNDVINVAIIVSSALNAETNTLNESHYERLLSGLKSSDSNNNLINVASTLYRNNELLGAEGLTVKILSDNPNVNVIFCTNAKDTIAAARIIVERNLVGEVYIVGTDVNDEIISLVNKGIVYGVVDRNGYTAGYESLEVLLNVNDGKFQESYIDVDIDVYSKVNIATYDGN